MATDVNHLYIFLAIGLLYVFTGVVVQVAYWRSVDRAIPLTFFFFGTAIMMAVNRHWLFVNVNESVALYMAAVLLLFGWVASVMVVRSTVSIQTRLDELEIDT